MSESYVVDVFPEPPVYAADSGEARDNVEARTEDVGPESRYGQKGTTMPLMRSSNPLIVFCKTTVIMLSITLSLAIFSTAFIAIAVLKAIAVSYRNPLNRIPGPWHSRYTNLRLKVAVMSGQRIHYIDALHQRYGLYVRVSPTEVAVNDPAGFKKIHFITAGFEKSSWYSDLVMFERPTVFTMTGNKEHAARRRMLARGFSKSNIRQNWESVVRDNIELAVSQMRAESREKGCCDVLKWWTLMATDASTKVMFGECFNTLQRGEVNEYIQVLQAALQGGGIGAELPWVRTIGSKMPFRAAWQMFSASRYLMDYGKIAVKNMKTGQGSQNVFANILAESEKGERLDESDVVHEATALIVAGTDTTAVTLTYLVWAVLTRPDLQAAVEQEVRGLPADFKDADVEQLPLVSAVIEETLRLYGAAPGGLPRTVPHGGVEMGGYWFPEGTTVTTQSYSLHRDADNFYNPHEFDVSRWLPTTSDKNSSKLSDAGKAINSPFGAGSRSCLGVHLARAELRSGAAMFFRECAGARLAPSATPECMALENFFLIVPAGHKCEVII